MVKLSIISLSTIFIFNCDVLPKSDSIGSLNKSVEIREICGDYKPKKKELIEASQLFHSHGYHIHIDGISNYCSFIVGQKPHILREIIPFKGE